MSKKVLKLAGRRPMLLALIMATAILGLLFSGWLTPTPGRAQTGGGNSSSGNENTNCPNYTTNAPSVSCPSITNNGALSATSFCVNQGDSSPPWPTLNPPPSASSGQVIITTTETCSNIVTSATNSVSYSFSGLNHRNGNGPPDGNSKAGNYWSDYYVTVTSSDTNNCPASQSEIDYGNVTWTVVDTNITSITVDPAKTLKAINQAIQMIQTAAKASGCTGTNMTFQGSITCSWQQVCCNITNGPYKKSSVSGSIKVGLPSLTCPIPGCSIPIPYPVSDYAQLGLTFTLDGSGNASASLGVAQPCQQQPICVNAGATVKGTLALSGSISAPYGWISCSASAGGSGSVSVQTSGPDTQGNCSIGANLGKGDLVWSVSLKVAGGITCKNWGGTQNLWSGYVVTNQIDCLCF